MSLFGHCLSRRICRRYVIVRQFTVNRICYCYRLWVKTCRRDRWTLIVTWRVTESNVASLAKETYRWLLIFARQTSCVKSAKSEKNVCAVNFVRSGRITRETKTNTTVIRKRLSLSPWTASRQRFYVRVGNYFCLPIQLRLSLKWLEVDVKSTYFLDLRRPVLKADDV